MSVSVIPRLRQLLEQRGLTIAELERRIEQDYGERVDPKGLYRLASDEPMQRADLRIAGAAASVLEVGLGDLFTIEAVRLGRAQPQAAYLSPEQARRLSRLLDRQARGRLNQDERHEMDDLVQQYGQRLHEAKVREYASRRGLSLDQARADLQHDLGEQVQAFQAERATAPRAGSHPSRRRARASRTTGRA